MKPKNWNSLWEESCSNEEWKMGKWPAIVKAAGIVTAITAIGKILGFLRESIIAAFFGTSAEADVFFVASLVPTILFTALGTAIQAGIVPIYLREKEKNAKEAARLIGSLGAFFVFVAIAAAILAILAARPLVSFLAPGFSADQLRLAERLTVILVPAIVFMTLTSVASGVLHANQKFAMPALTSTVQNLAVILSALFLARPFGVIGLACGFLAGTALQFFIQWPSLKRYRVRFPFPPQKRGISLRETLSGFYPVILASVAVQINGVTDRMISSTLDEGSISSLNYAYRLLWLPLSVMIGPLITVLYPSIVGSALKGAKPFGRIVGQGFRTIIYLSIPFMLVMIISGKALIRLAFERGAFDASDTVRTYGVFICYGIGLAFFALRDYLMNCFYALKENRLVMHSCLWTVLLNIGFSLLLSRFYGAAGIALAGTMAMLFQTVYLLVRFRRKSGLVVSGTEGWRDWGKYALLFAFPLSLLLPARGTVEKFPDIAELFLVSAMVFSFHFFLSWLLKMEEPKRCLALLAKNKSVTFGE
ncbi:MAG: murein biosynthesis integral membrane protein MurJ [Caldibacillus debilis]|nr:MAG: murein biosynthesis integral membrane protein MurJ [Caldibacillus debilis]